MDVKSIMSRRLVTVELDDKLSTVKDIFDSMGFHHVLAVEQRKLLGVVSDRDLYKALSPNIGTLTETYKDAATLNKRVHQIMTRRPFVLHEDATVDEAIDLFNAHPVSCIPIVDRDQHPVGILSWRDILKSLRPPPSPPAA